MSIGTSEAQLTGSSPAPGVGPQVRIAPGPAAPLSTQSGGLE